MKVYRSVLDYVNGCLISFNQSSQFILVVIIDINIIWYRAHLRLPCTVQQHGHYTV